MFDCFSWINDNLALISAFGVLLGAVVALRQWAERIKIQRAEFVKELIEKLRFDPAVTEAGYMVDHGQFKCAANFYDPSNKHVEMQIDKYLSYLSYLCYLIETRSVTKREMQLFEYKLVRTLRSPAVQTYLWNLVHFSKKFKINCSFHNLVVYGIKREVIGKDFLTNDKDRFTKILTF